MKEQSIQDTARARRFGRRKFLFASVAGAGGLCLGFAMPDEPGKHGVERASAQLPPPPGTGQIQAPPSGPGILNAFLTVGTDEIVTVRFGGCEFGQGTMSGFAQAAADELRVDWAQVRAEQADASINPATGQPISFPLFMAGASPANVLYSTGGSGAFRNGNRFALLRMAGATAREMLITAAASEFGVDRSLCSASNGKVLGPAGRSLTYGQLAAAAAQVPVPTVTVADPSVAQFNLIGQRLPRLDIPGKVDGSAKFGLDIRLPGMLYAAVRHAPTTGGTLSGTPSVPSGARYAFPLVAEVTRGDVVKGSTNAVAVVATNSWLTMRGSRNLKATWKTSATVNQLDTNSLNTTAAGLMSSGTVLPGELRGDPEAELASAASLVDSTYSFPYIPHVSMEVLNCTVRYTPTMCEVWAPTQSASGVVNTAKGLTGFGGSQVIVHTTLLGGGNGRKIEMDYVSQAIQTAMALYQKTGSGVVKLMWPREEDFSNDQYRPTALVRVRMGASGSNIALSYRTITPSIRAQRGSTLTSADSTSIEGAAASLYGFSSRRVEQVLLPAGVPVGFWRSVGHSLNTFALESALDELAIKLGRDQIDLRRELLAANPDPKATRALAVLNAAADASPWRSSLPAGHAWGVAFAEAYGTLVCQVVDVSAPTAGALRVHRVACAVDCGTAVNPGSVEAQMQGGIAHGISSVLWGQTTFTKGVASPRNFNAFKMLSAREMPRVTVSIINSGAAIGGIGEPGVPPIGPAIANAYFRITGTRVRSLPFFPAAGGFGGG